MSENKRFTIKSQDNYFGITDNNAEDKVNVINGIHTEIEAEWLCDLLNELSTKCSQLEKENKGIQDKVWVLLEFLEVEYGIDKRKVIDWWNGDVE